MIPNCVWRRLTLDGVRDPLTAGHGVNEGLIEKGVLW